MSIPLNNLALFSLALLFGLVMLVEGYLVGILHKQMVPLPSKVLHWISARLIGKEKSARHFSGKNTPKNLRTYGILVILFGSCIIVSSFIYLVEILPA